MAPLGDPLGAGDPRVIEASAAAGATMSKKWYVVHTYSGFENKAKKALEERIKLENLGEMFGEIMIPMENVVEMVKGEQRTSKRKFFPGYILVQMELNDRTKHLVKNTPKVTGFLGSGNKPQPISEKEASRYFGGVEEAKAAPKREINIDYEIGDSVKVNAGPFASFTGIVEELDFDKSKVKVSVSIFGRATPVELGFDEVELVK
jgi:transcription termination/antitermination protein NusG